MRSIAKLISLIIMLAAAAVVVALAIANRDPVTLSLDPLPRSLELPLYLHLIGAMAVGFLWGCLATWVSNGKTRLRAREGIFRADKAEREAKALREKVERLVAAAEQRQRDQAPALPAADAA